MIKRSFKLVNFKTKQEYIKMNPTYKLFQKGYLLVLVFLLAGIYGIQAQTITYAEPSRSENRQINFDIIGKYEDHYLIYKNYRNVNYISRYDQGMKLEENVALPFLPERLTEVNFLAYPDFAYLFYQFNRRGIVYMNVVKIGPSGTPLTEPIELDTTHIGFGGDSKVYQVLASEDKSKIALLKVNTRNERNYYVTTLLYDNALNLNHRSDLVLAMRQRNDFLTDFSLDNKGNVVFGKGTRIGNSDNISKFMMIVKPAAADSFLTDELSFENITLDGVKLKIDNYNNRYLFSSFFYGSRRTIIEGILNAIYDADANSWVVNNAIPFTEEMRQDARGKNNTRNAFNDYFIQDIAIRSDGAFMVNAESQYQTSRGGYNPYNRWNLYNPFMTGSYYYPWGVGGYGNPWNSWYSPYGGMNNMTRFNADDIMVMAFSNEGRMILSNFVHKSQFDDYADNAISFKTFNTGNGLHFLYNEFDRREFLLNYQTLTPDGKIVRNPSMKNLRPEFTLMNRYAKQVSINEMIIPALYRNYMTFALLKM